MSSSTLPSSVPQRIDVEYSADSAEFCPVKGWRQFLAVGTYQLKDDPKATPGDDTPKLRLGRLYLYACGGGGTRGSMNSDAAAGDINSITTTSSSTTATTIASITEDSEAATFARSDSISTSTSGCERRTLLTELQRQNTPAITDMKWLPLAPYAYAGDAAPAAPLLAVATADGTIELYSLCNDGSASRRHSSSRSSATELRAEAATAGTARLVKQSVTLVVPSGQLALSIEWTTLGPGAARLAVSDQDGCVSIWVLTPPTDGHVVALAELQRWTAHSFPAWITCWDAHSSAGTVVYSGGDDCLFKGWDARCGGSESSEQQSAIPLFVNKRHGMGVCAMQSNRHREHLLATGSYDEIVRLWDTRSLRAPIAECDIGGGLWRLKWHPHDPTLLLAAGMHGGFHVLRADGVATGGGGGGGGGGGEGGTASRRTELEDKRAQETGVAAAATAAATAAIATDLAIEASLDTKGELAYGVDWCAHPATHEQSIIAACTFYNHELNLWMPDDVAVAVDAWQ